MGGVLLLAGPGPSTWVVANALAREHDDLSVVIEEREARSAFLARRLRRFGPVTVAGQALFQLYGLLGARRAAPRVREIMAEAGLDATPMPAARLHRVVSVNEPSLVAQVAEKAPDVVVVNGTRILGRALLSGIRAPVLNMHAGITPAYRGVHGGYWARARGDAERCGVTVHLVDQGVDTGRIVAQARISPGDRDSYFSYPTLQLAAGLPLMLRAVRDARAGRLASRPAEGESRQYFHPTLWGYLATGLTRGVW